ncbi:hypothetical protein TNCV_1818141 [Trichonephila clavipes]|nr:hypothetical protein TNCV_1818141 [Trichonephila clavipes]
MSKHRYIQKTDCLVRFMGWWNPPSKTMKATTLQSMVIAYRAMITNFFIPELNNFDVQELWLFQTSIGQAPCRHTARATTDFIEGTRLVTRPNFNALDLWSGGSLRSCDLTTARACSTSGAM